MAAALLAALTLAAPSARAHGTAAPQLVQLLFHPSDPDTIVVVANFGLLVTEDGGSTWEWVCPEAISGQYTLLGRGFLDDYGTVTFGSPQGVTRGESLGCDWSRPSVELDGVYIADMDTEPADRSLALTWERDGSSFVFGTEDAGRTWDGRSAPLPARLISQGVRASPSDPERVYVTGIDPSGGRPFVFRSDTRGDAWDPVALDAPSDEFGFLVLGVDPTNRDRVYLRALAPGHDRVAVSNDGANAFVDIGILNAAALAAGRPFGFAFAADGVVWLGNPLAGLLRLEGSTLRPARADLAVTCVEARGPDLWIGLDGQAGDAVAEVVRAPDGDIDALEPVMSYEQVTGIRSCASPEVREICDPYWDDLRRHVALLPPLDAGASVDGGTATASSAGCGCRVSARPRGGHGLLAVLALIATLRRARASA